MDAGDDAFDRFTADLDPAAALVVTRVTAAVTGAGIPLDTAIRWGRLTFAVDGDFHHWLCGIAVTRKGVSLQLHFGGLLADPDGRLIAGSSRFGRSLLFTSPEGVDPDVVGGFVRAAADRLPFFRENWRAIQAGTVDPAAT